MPSRPVSSLGQNRILADSGEIHSDLTRCSNLLDSDISFELAQVMLKVCYIFLVPVEFSDAHGALAASSEAARGRELGLGDRVASGKRQDSGKKKN